jgi:S-methylmethionine-dependent homocysteine/selenocysteine methylase
MLCRLQTAGRLPTCETLHEAIEQVDGATDRAPVYFRINCAHPTHFQSPLDSRGAWTERIRALRATSAKSHVDLAESTKLDEANPMEFGSQYLELITRLPHINVLGGCFGTESRHVCEIAEACARR